MIVKVAGPCRPCRHRSPPASTTAVVFSATLGVAAVVITGALSFSSVSVTVIVCVVVFDAVGGRHLDRVAVRLRSRSRAPR